MSDSAVIAEMKRQIFALENKVRELDSRIPIRVAPPPPAAVEPETRIFHPTVNVLMPSPDELKTLAGIVLAKFNSLGPAPGEEARWKWDFEFENALRAVQSFGRIDGLSDRCYFAGWVEKFEDFLRASGSSTDLSPGSMIAAILASGDVPHNYPHNHKLGETLAFGLADPGSGRLADPRAYRNVLAGQLRERISILPPTKPAPRASPAVVFHGGDASMFRRAS